MAVVKEGEPRRKRKRRPARPLITATNIREMPYGMLREDFPHELMGLAEVAECLKINISNFQTIKDQPEPIAHLKSGRIWLGSEVRAFAKLYEQRRTQRRKGEEAA